MDLDNTGYAVLLIDDEKSILSSLKRLLRKEDYEIITASSGEEGLEILKSNDIQVVISDQRMPGLSGTEFLSEVKKDFPDIIRIILSGYTDIDVIIETINKGSIYKFFHKPWNDQSLILEIRQALDYYRLVQDNTRLSFQNKALLLYHAVLENISLPIIGINAEKAVAIYNKKASNMQLDNMDIQIGSEISKSFPEKIVNLINNCFKDTKPETLEYFNENKNSYHITCTPFTGRFAGKGVVLSFMPVFNDIQEKT